MAHFYASAGRRAQPKVHADLLHALKLLDDDHHVALEFDVPASWRLMRAQVDALVIRTGSRGYFRVIEVKGLEGKVDAGLAGPWSGASHKHRENPFEQVSRIGDAMYWFLSRDWPHGQLVSGVYRTVVLPRLDVTSRFTPPRFIRYCLGYRALLDDLTAFVPGNYTAALTGTHVADLVRRLGLKKVNRVNDVDMDGPHDPEAALRRARRRLEEMRAAIDGVEKDLEIIASRPTVSRGKTPSKKDADVAPPTPTARVSAEAERAPDGDAFERAAQAVVAAVHVLQREGRTCSVPIVVQRASPNHEIDPKTLGFSTFTRFLQAAEKRGLLRTWVDPTIGQRIVGPPESSGTQDG